MMELQKSCDLHSIADKSISLKSLEKYTFKTQGNILKRHSGL